MNIIVKAGQRVVETASLCLKQSAELNRRLSLGQVSGRRYVREAVAIWRYNLKNFWHPEPDPVHSASELVAASELVGGITPSPAHSPAWAAQSSSHPRSGCHWR